MKRFLLATTILAAVGASSAYAANVTWDFGEHTGLLGNTQVFDGSDGATIKVEGFTASDVGTALFSKTDPLDESGIGLANDPTGNDEIRAGNFVLINLDGTRDKLISDFTFSMNSTTLGEGWSVYGSLDATPFTFTHLLDGFDEGSHSLANGYDNYAFFYDNALCGTGCGNQNVLIGSISGTAAAVPEIPHWAMLMGGFGLMAALGWKRQRGARFAI